uniref:peptide-methionine (S)-S-oxide reductase n=1 Tax=Hyaloperonospora arabidopsidis (strain Emoy2) TaxID=559515 RepID=M4BRQ0_HYAAE
MTTDTCHASQPQNVAMFAAGCDWGVQLAPTYAQVCTGKTKHAEAIKIVFDDRQVSYDALLSKFWSIYDPTSLNRQNTEQGTQYRSGVCYHTEEQGKAALASKEEHQKTLSKPIVTEIEAAKQIWAAEDHH